MLKNYSPPNSNQCPKCHSDQAPNILVCTLCGYNFRVVLYNGVIAEPVPVQHWTQQPLSVTTASAKRFLSTTGGALAALLAVCVLLTLLFVGLHVRNVPDPPPLTPVQTALRPVRTSPDASGAPDTDPASTRPLQPSFPPQTGAILNRAFDQGYARARQIRAAREGNNISTPDFVPSIVPGEPPFYKPIVNQEGLLLLSYALQSDGAVYGGDITGMIVNNRASLIRAARVSFLLYDSAGNEVGIAQSSIDNLLSGQRWEFAAHSGTVRFTQIGPPTLAGY